MTSEQQHPPTQWPTLPASPLTRTSFEPGFGPVVEPEFALARPAPTGQGPDPTDGSRGPAARALARAGVGLAGVATVVGAYLGIDLALAHTNTAQASYPAPGVVELVADGAVSVRAGGADVQVERIARAGIASPQYAVSESGGRLTITHQCSWWQFGVCSGALEVTLPADTEVAVRTSNGAIRAAGVARDVQAVSSNGLVEVSDAGAAVRAESSNGDVTVRGAGGTVQATTSNGSVLVSEAGGGATVQSSNGAVGVQGAAGDVVARSSNGAVTVSGVAGDVDAETSNGNVTVRGTGDPVALEIGTSNGRQEVSGPTDPGAARQVRIRSSNGDVSYLDGP